jgi:hypothetical protein
MPCFSIFKVSVILKTVSGVKLIFCLFVENGNSAGLKLSLNRKIQYLFFLNLLFSTKYLLFVLTILLKTV